MIHRRGTMLWLALGCIYSANAAAQPDAAMMVKRESGQPLSEPLSHNICAPDGVAVGGFDLISYRSESGPVAGSAEFAAEHDGLTYLFADNANLQTFRGNPQRYLPEYGGLCAITLALGRVTCPEYSNFKIEEDRLLLFEVTGFTNGRTLWDSDPTNFRGKADENFIELKN